MPKPYHNKITHYIFCLVFLFVMGVGVVGAEAIPSVGVSRADQLGLRDTATLSGFGPDATEIYVSPAEFIGQILGLILSLLGVVFVVLIIFSGYMWIIARGNEEDAQKALDIAINATIGVVIVFSAYAISSYLMQSLYQATLRPQ